MASYYCNILVAQVGDQREELASPEWTDVRTAFDAVRKGGSGSIQLGRLSGRGQGGEKWLSPVVQLDHAKEESPAWRLKGFDETRECTAEFSTYDAACHALLRAFNSETSPQLSARDGWVVVRDMKRDKLGR